jgi:hypothetical protein
MPSAPDAALAKTVSELWEHEVEPQLRDYITIPALSPAFQPD